MRFFAFLFPSLITPVHSARGVGGRTCRVLFLGGGQNDPETLHPHDGSGSRTPRVVAFPDHREEGGP